MLSEFLDKEIVTSLSTVNPIEVRVMQKVPMTIRGEQKLREELARLLKLRPIITKAIGEARELGDLKENAEYHAAREEQGICEAQIRDIEYKLSVAQIIDIAKIENNGKVIFGSTVTITDLVSDAQSTYQIVGEDEAEIKSGRISVSSPIARGLVGKLVGDDIIISTPSGDKEFEIDKVSYV